MSLIKEIFLTCLFTNILMATAFADVVNISVGGSVKVGNTEIVCGGGNGGQCTNFGGTVYCGYSCENFGGTVYCAGTPTEVCTNFGGSVYCGESCKNFGGSVYCVSGGLAKPAKPARP